MNLLTHPFRVLKARKATYGFEAQLDINTIQICADAAEFLQKYEDTFSEFSGSASTGALMKVYSFNDKFVEEFTYKFVFMDY